MCVRVKLSHGDNSTILNGLKQQSAPKIKQITKPSPNTDNLFLQFIQLHCKVGYSLRIPGTAVISIIATTINLNFIPFKKQYLKPSNKMTFHHNFFSFFSSGTRATTIYFNKCSHMSMQRIPDRRT